MPCLDIIPPNIIANTVPYIRKWFESGSVGCVDPDSAVLETYLGEDGPATPSLQFLPCQESDDLTCSTAEETDQWFTKNEPKLVFLGTKRLVDFMEAEDFIYE